ncbi:MAG TPA: hypothetical protein VHY20_00940, partial [Pirellulales bacterium]|nr:hypothetical protein [Pirellulales bacterium]
LSCASSAGIEAAAAGWPVIQLMPAGSGELLNAKTWGLVGTARSRDELEELIRTVLAGNPLPHSEETSLVIAASGPAGARRIVDALLSPAATQAGGVTDDGAFPAASPVAETACV